MLSSGAARMAGKRRLWIFTAGFIIRLIAVACLARATPAMLTWGSNEPGGIARWIVQTHSFSSPFHDAHGPTAWLGPVYPLIVAVAFLLFGVQTKAAALAVMVFNAACSAATGVVVHDIGKELGSEKAGLLAGCMWACSPYIVILPYLLWDTSLCALMLATALLQTLRLRSATSEAWAGCGALWGVAGLVSPSLLTPLPILALLLLEWGKKWRRVAILTLFTVAVILPWTARNYFVFHRFILIRSNGLSEVYFANVSFDTHPLGSSMEYQRLGEAAFTAETNRRALEFMKTEPLVFVRNSCQRAMWFWIYPTNCWPITVGIDFATLAGLIVLSRKSRAMAVTLIAVLEVYPLIYYASQVVSRYRHPIEPVLYALSGIALSRISLRRSGG